VTVFIVPGPIDTATGGFRYDRRIIAELRRAGVAVEVVELGGGWPLPDEADRARAAACLAAIADGACVVVDGLAFGALPGLVEQHARRLRFVALVHHPLWMEDDPTAGAALQPPPDSALARAEIAALAHARRVIVTSSDTAAAVAAMGVAPARIAVVEPGCDPFPIAGGAIAPSDAAGDAGGGAHGAAPVRLLCVATVTPRKGLIDVVAALARLRSGVGEHAGRAGDAGDASAAATVARRRRPWRLDVVGSTERDPAYVREVRAAIAAAGMAGQVRLVGEVAEAELPRWYAAADGLVSASRHEGYGMSLAEALMHGLPVVATRAGAIAATVDGAARLVAVGDVDALATAIAEVLLDDEGRAAQAAASRRWRAARLESAGWPVAARRFAAALADV
jgi:glycosyltransferase involved in cell wall biosynthesis